MKNKFVNNSTLPHKLYRFLWIMLSSLFFMFLPYYLGNRIRWLLLRLFGAKIHWTSVVNHGVRIYSPKNLVMGENSCLAFGVDCYNVDLVHIGSFTTISQRTFICTASHDFYSLDFKLVTKPIYIGSHSWVAAECFISPGVKIPSNTMFKARSFIK